MLIKLDQLSGTLLASALQRLHRRCSAWRMGIVERKASHSLSMQNTRRTGLPHPPCPSARHFHPPIPPRPSHREPSSTAASSSGKMSARQCLRYNVAQMKRGQHVAQQPRTRQLHNIFHRTHSACLLCSRPGQLSKTFFPLIFSLEPPELVPTLSCFGGPSRGFESRTAEMQWLSDRSMYLSTDMRWDDFHMNTGTSSSSNFHRKT